MKVEIRFFKSFAAMPGQVRQRCKALTFRPESGMREILRNEGEEHIPVWVAFHRKTVIGWALLHCEDAMFYVHRKYRRRGIGSKLYNRVHRYSRYYAHREPDVFPHDSTSCAFFDRVHYGYKKPFFA